MSFQETKRRTLTEDIKKIVKSIESSAELLRKDNAEAELLFMDPEIGPAFLLYTPKTRILWFGSTREYRSHWPKFSIFSASSARDATLQTKWRRERDSNPRYPCG